MLKPILAVLLMAVCFCRVDAMPRQTDVHNAKHLFDDKGIAYLLIAGVGKTYNPSTIAAYALGYANAESYLEDQIAPNEQKFRNSIDYLVSNLKKNSAGYSVWLYDFDSTYNDITVKAPWFSAFGQAVGIEALSAGYERFKDKKYLDAAIAAAEVFFVPLADGGLLFNENGLTLFEEIPAKENPSHILNGHLRSMLALHKLYKATGDKKYWVSFQKGAESIKKLMPLYDSGYAFRYDLNPRKQELLFRFNNPYNGLLPAIPIDSVKLIDPLTGESSFLDIGKNGDAASACRIAGNDWLFIESCDGRSVRKLKTVMPVNPLHAADGGMNSPGTYFYLTLPGTWDDNLREKWFELEVTYKDTVRSPLVVEMRSMAPGVAFRPLRDGDLMLTGSGEWRTQKVPVRVSDLGYWCGELYAKMHKLYLEKLAKIDSGFKVFAERAEKYYRQALFHNTGLGGASQKRAAVKVDKSSAGIKLPVRTLYSSFSDVKFSAISSTVCYKNHGIDKSLDKDPNNGYTACLESQKDYELVLGLKTAQDAFDLELIFESAQNYSDQWTVTGLSATGKRVFEKTIKGDKQTQNVQVKSSEKIKKLHLRFQSFQGQNRLLLRRISGVVKNADSSMQLLYLYASFAALQMELNNVKFYNAEKQGRITVWASESSRRKLRQLYSGNIRGETQVALTGSASSVLVEMKGFSADLSFYASPKSYDNYKQFLKDDKVILYRPDDTANPLYIIRAPITLAHKKFADDICSKEGAKTDLEKVLAFMKYITYFDVGLPVDSKLSGALLEKVGDCGPFTMVLNALACASGLKVKNINLCNYPKDDGHSVSEILINEKWRIFDPTYGLYFKDSKTGELMSFEDLRNPANKAIPVYINKERYTESGERTGWGTQRAYLYANPAGVIGPDKPMYFPLKMNLQSLSQIFFPQNGASHQGGYYIGSEMTNNNHVWELSGLTPGKKYSLQYDFSYCGGSKSLPVFDISCRIEKGTLLKNTFSLKWEKPGVINIVFTAHDPTVKLVVEHPYSGYDFVYASVRRVKLAEL